MPTVDVTPARTADIDDAIRRILSARGVLNRRLAGLLDPVDGELLTTLDAWIAADYLRDATARNLHVHNNTVDYRLKRIGQLTGINTSTLSGKFRLTAAAIALRGQTPPPIPPGAHCRRHHCTDCIICGLGLED